MPSHYHKHKGRHPPKQQRARPSYPNVERVLKVLNAGFVGHAAYRMLGLDRRAALPPLTRFGICVISKSLLDNK